MTRDNVWVTVNTRLCFANEQNVYWGILLQHEELGEDDHSRSGVCSSSQEEGHALSSRYSQAVVSKLQEIAHCNLVLLFSMEVLLHWCA